MTKEARKRVRQDKARQGLCSTEGCHQPQVEGKTKCQVHLDRDAINARKRSEKSIAAGKCPRCKCRAPAPGRKYCRTCLDECNEATKANYREDKSKQQAASARWRADKIAAGLCTQCGENPVRPGKENCGDCAEDKSFRQRRLHAEQRRLVLEHYGKACVCCGDTTVDLLQIDHIKGGGTKHLKAIGLGKLYKWLIDNNFPEGFQPLCGSCNHGWGHLRYCPHAEGRLVEVVVDGKKKHYDPATGKFAKPAYPEPLALGKKARQQLKKASHAIDQDQTQDH
jgi:hypothetical protein